MADFARLDDTAPSSPPTETIDDAIAALAGSVADEIAGMTEAELADHLLLSSIRQVIRLHESDAPDFLIDLANQRMHRNLRRLRERRRVTQTADAETGAPSGPVTLSSSHP
jgi:hypothetical protein